MDRKKFAKKILSLFLASAMLIGIAPVNTFAETTKADWTIDEKKEAEMSYWKLSNKNEVTVVANAEGIKTPSVNYIGTYINAEGRTVIRVSFRMFQNLASGVWDKALFKFDKDLYDLIDFGNSGTGMYKGAINGVWHDSATYKDIAAFTNVVSSLSGAVNVKEQNLDSNGNKVGASSRIEIPIDLVLKDGKTVGDIKGQPHIQMRITNKDYSKVFCVAGTEKSDTKNIITTPYNSYTFMTYVPSKNNNANVGTVEDYRIDQQFYSANSYAKYNQAGGYLDVFHKQSKLASGDQIAGEAFAFRQVFNEDFAKVLKPQDESGTVAEVFPASQQGDPWSNVEKIKITQSDLNTSENSDLNPGFTGIQVATNKVGNIPQKFAGLKTVFTTASAETSYLNGTTTEFNSGLPTITRYYVDPEKVAAEGLKDDDLAAFDFYSTFILEGTRKFIEYSATNDTGSDIILQPNTKLTLTYDGGNTVAPDLNEDNYSLIFGEEPYKIELRSNFNHVGKVGSTFGKIYEYTLVPGMTIKAGEKITFRTMKYKTPPNNVTLTLPGVDGEKQIVLNPGADGAEKTTPRRLNYITTYAGGSATQSGLNPDIDELFTDSQNITGRTIYNGAKIKLFYPDNKDYEFTIAEQTTRTKLNINGSEENGYTFTTEGQGGFTMPTELVKDSVIGITNTDVKKASTPSEKVFEKIQAKVTFDLNGGKLPTTTKSFEGYKANDKTNLPGTEFAYKLDRAKETDPVVRIAPMSEKAASDADYTPNGFKVDKYIDHNGDVLTGDALALRKFITDEPKKANTQLLGWTTKKLEGTPEEVKKAFDKLKKATTADEVNGKGNFIFTKTSPITKGINVYAAYGPVQSAVYNPEQKYDEKSDKQYIEATPADKNTKAGDGATYKLVKKNADGTYTPVEGVTQTKKADGSPVFEITNTPSKNFDPEAEYVIETVEKDKEPSYSTTPIKIDKKGPEIKTEENSVVQDAYGYQAKIAANAEDTSGILRIYVDDDKRNGYSNSGEKVTQAKLEAQLVKQRNKEKNYKITAVDKLGNKTIIERVLQTKQEDVDLQVDDSYDGDDFLEILSEKGATIEIKINGNIVKTARATGNYDEISLDNELTSGQKIEVTAKLNGKSTKTITITVR